MRGYKRANGKIGIRNHVLVMYTAQCSHHVAQMITRSVPGTELVGFSGCYHDPYGYKMLAELGKHPNVAAVLVVRIGCESFNVQALVEEISSAQKPVQLISIQESNGTTASINKGVEIAKKMVEDAQKAEMVDISIKDLIIGVECGGSDATSGISANPVAGWAVDRVIEQGGTVIFSELPELLGCREYLNERAVNDTVREQINDGLYRAQELGNLLKTFAVSVGNEDGGLTTIEEKSLGALCKAGTKPIDGVIKTGMKPPGPGLYLLDKVGTVDTNQLSIYEISDNDGIITLIASGAHLVIFTTGRGNVIGSVVTPVIKVCGNPDTCRNMGDDMDIHAGSIIEGESSVAEVGQTLLERIYEVAGGAQSRAEALGHKEYEIPFKPARACDVL